MTAQPAARPGRGRGRGLYNGYNGGAAATQTFQQWQAAAYNPAAYQTVAQRGARGRGRGGGRGAYRPY